MDYISHIDHMLNVFGFHVGFSSNCCIETITKILLSLTLEDPLHPYVGKTIDCTSIGMEGIFYNLKHML